MNSSLTGRDSLISKGARPTPPSIARIRTMFTPSAQDPPTLARWSRTNSTASFPPAAASSSKTCAASSLLGARSGTAPGERPTALVTWACTLWRRSVQSGVPK